MDLGTLLYKKISNRTKTKEKSSRDARGFLGYQLQD